MNRLTMCKTGRDSFVFSNFSLKVLANCYAGRSKLSRLNSFRFNPPPGAVRHSLWEGKQFETVSNPLPSLTIGGTITNQSHILFRRTLAGLISIVFVGTGVQNCSSGPEILKLLEYPYKYLVQTSHRMGYIMNNQLDKKCVLFIHIRIGLRETNMSNMSGLYL